MLGRIRVRVGSSFGEATNQIGLGPYEVAKDGQTRMGYTQPNTSMYYVGARQRALKMCEVFRVRAETVVRLQRDVWSMAY